VLDEGREVRHEGTPEAFRRPENEVDDEQRAVSTRMIRVLDAEQKKV
jgi:hypothetical protein